MHYQDTREGFCLEASKHLGQGMSRENTCKIAPNTGNSYVVAKEKKQRTKECCQDLKSHEWP